MALSACARRCLLREAMFLCTIFLSAKRSITPCCAWNTFSAAALSPAAMAFLTLRTALRSADFRLALRLCVAADCRARFFACAVFAINAFPRVFWRDKKRPGIIIVFALCRNPKPLPMGCEPEGWIVFPMGYEPEMRFLDRSSQHGDRYERCATRHPRAVARVFGRRR